MIWTRAEGTLKLQASFIDYDDFSSVLDFPAETTTAALPFIKPPRKQQLFSTHYQLDVSAEVKTFYLHGLFEDVHLKLLFSQQFLNKEKRTH